MHFCFILYASPYFCKNSYIIFKTNTGAQNKVDVLHVWQVYHDIAQLDPVRLDLNLLLALTNAIRLNFKLADPNVPNAITESIYSSLT